MEYDSVASLAEFVCHLKTTSSTLKTRVEELTIHESDYTDKLDAILLWACRRGWTDFAMWFLALQQFMPDVIYSRVRYHLEDKGVTYKSYQLYPYCLIDEKNRIKCRDFHTESLLHGGVVSGTCDTVLYLLQAGASVDAINCCDQTPLSIACQLCHVDVCLVLLKHGACVNHQDSRGYTPLMYACSARKSAHLSCSLTHLLLQHGADVCITNKQGLTALHIAVAHQNAYALQALFAGGHLPRTGHEGFPTVTFSGHHLFVSPIPDRRFTSICQVITSCTKLSSFHKAEMYMLLATMIFESLPVTSLLDPCKKIIEKAFNISTHFAFTQDNFKVDPIYEPYFFVVKTSQDVAQMLSSSQSVMYERVAYLCLVARECFLGSCSLPTINLMFKVGQRLLFQGSSDFSRTLGIWLRASTMLRAFSNSLFPDLDYLYTCKNIFLYILLLVRRACLKIPLSTSFAESTTTIISNVLGSVVCYLSLLYQAHAHTPSSRAMGLVSLMDESIRIVYWLWILSEKETCPVTSVAEIGREFVCSCSEIIGKDFWPSNLLQYCVVSHFPAEFIEAMLQWGAGKYINDTVGPYYNRPLHCSQNAQVTMVLLEYGAHFDAVNKAGKAAVDTASAELDCDVVCQFIPPPLSCLSAKAVLYHHINYRDIDYPQSLKIFIAYHDVNCL